MSKAPTEAAGQGAMIEVSRHNDDGLRSATLTVREQFPDTPEIPGQLAFEPVDEVTQAGHLIRSLNSMALHSRGAGYKKHKAFAPDDLMKKYGWKLEVVSEGVANNQSTHFTTAYDEFCRSQDYPRKIAAGILTQEAANEQAGEAFKAFLGTYYGPANHDKLDSYRKQLKKIVAGKVSGVLSVASVTQESTPAAEDPKALTAEEKAGLPPRDKLIMLHDAEKFLAHNYDELTEALVLSGVMHDDPLGVARHLQEKGDHNAKQLYARRQELRNKEEHTAEEQAELDGLTVHHITEVASNTVKSAALEYYDYYANASQKLTALRKLEALVDDSVNHRITVPEAIDDADQDPADFLSAVATVVQVIDLERLRKHGTPMTYDPLRNVEEDRDYQNHPEKNKTLTDPYTAKNREEVILNRIKQYIDTYKIVDVLPRIQAAIKNEGTRMVFWDKVLNGVKGPAKRVISDLREAS